MNRPIADFTVLPAPRRSFASWLAFRPRQRLASFSLGQVAILFLLLLLIAAIPLLTHRLPPLEDYTNHLARMHVIEAIGRDPDLAKFYEIDWEIVPNLMMDLIVPVLARFMNIYAAGQVFTIGIFALIMSGVLMLHRSLFRSWSILPMIAFPFLYNYVFLIGVMNYQAGIGLTLWGLAAWVALRDRAWPWRYAVSIAFVLALFASHLFAVGVYGVGLLAFEAWRLLQRNDLPLGRRLGAFVAAGIPFLPVLPLMLASPTLKHIGDFSWEEDGKIDGLLYVLEVYSDVIALAFATVLVAACAWAVRRRLLRVHPLLFSILIVSTLVYIALPRTLFSTYMADQRLPIAIAFMAAACIDIDLRSRRVRRGFLALLTVLLVVRVMEVDVAWSEISPTTLEFRDSVRKIARGSRVLIAYADQTGGDDRNEFNLVHASCLAILERSALVTDAFTVPGKQIMHVRDAYRGQVDTEDGTPPTVEELGQALEAPQTHDVQTPAHYWQDWQDKFDYVYVLFTGDDAENPLPDRLTLAYDGDGFQLYKIKRAVAAAQTETPRPGVLLPAAQTTGRAVGLSLGDLSRRRTMRSSGQ